NSLHVAHVARPRPTSPRRGRLHLAYLAPLYKRGRGRGRGRGRRARTTRQARSGAWPHMTTDATTSTHARTTSAPAAAEPASHGTPPPRATTTTPPCDPRRAPTRRPLREVTPPKISRKNGGRDSAPPHREKESCRRKHRCGVAV